MQTTWISKKDIKRNWFIVDATDLVLGRLAAHVAFRLRGKHKSIYSPNIDCGDNFVIINARKIKMTGNKLSKKIYYKHTGYPGGLKETSYEDILNSKKPEMLIKLAVKRMLPKGVLGRDQLKKLYIYEGMEHPHEAQKPKLVNFKVLNRKNMIGQKIAS
jgi:large subunit ribosomal protein L13